LKDRNFAQATSFAFQKSPRPVLDVTDGSPLVAVWTTVIAPLYNNFAKYKPPYRFQGQDYAPLHLCDPNNKEMPRRVPDHLRQRFATLKSRFTVVFGNWKKSGQNNPAIITRYINIHSQIDVSILYMFRVLYATSNDTLLNRCSRALPTFAQVDSGNMAATLERLQGGGNRNQNNHQGKSSNGSDNNAHNDDNNNGDTRPRRTPSFELHQDLMKMLDAFNNEDGTEAACSHAIQLQTVQSNRDRAYDVMQRQGQQVRQAKTGRKRKRALHLYRCRRREWLQLEKQVSELTKTPFKEEDFEDDSSLCDSDSDDETPTSNEPSARNET